MLFLFGKPVVNSPTHSILTAFDRSRRAHGFENDLALILAERPISIASHQSLLISVKFRESFSARVAIIKKNKCVQKAYIYHAEVLRHEIKS